MIKCPKCGNELIVMNNGREIIKNVFRVIMKS